MLLILTESSTLLSVMTTVETAELMARAVPEVYKKLVGFDIINQAYQAVVQLLHQQHEDNSNIMSVDEPTHARLTNACQTTD